MTKLEPTAEQLELIARAAGVAVWEMQIAFDIANHGIPEGPPVGTIARRPDGHYLALRAEGEEPGTTYWKHLPLVHGPWGLSHRDDTDSWPVIYDPTGKTLDELHAEIDRLDKAEDSALRERDHWQETINRILYTCSSEDEIGEWSSANDPVERFIEQFRPVKRIDPTDHPSREELQEYFHKDLAEHCQADDPRDEVAANIEAVPMTKKYGKMFGVILETLDSVEFYGVDAPYLALQVHNALRAAGYDADPTAQQEPEEPGPPSNAHIKFPKAPRTPRVVDRLGVDEQGSRWLDAFGLVWSFGNGWWKSWGTG